MNVASKHICIILTTVAVLLVRVFFYSGKLKWKTYIFVVKWILKIYVLHDMVIAYITALIGNSVCECELTEPEQKSERDANISLRSLDKWKMKTFPSAISLFCIPKLIEFRFVTMLFLLAPIFESNHKSCEKHRCLNKYTTQIHKCSTSPPHPTPRLLLLSVCSYIRV